MKTLNISPNIIAICWLVGNVISVLACWWIISLLARYRAVVILCGLFALSRQQENHRRPVVVLFPSFPVSQDLNGTGTEDYHAFRFCVLTR